MRNPDLSSKLMDIEDMVTVGRTHKVCPFFMSRALQHEADLVIMPYNYVLDPKLRRTMKDSIDWDKTILIFDEAHNLEKICGDAASFSLTALQLASCIKEVQEAIDYQMEKSGASSTVESFSVTKSILCNLERAIAAHGPKLPPNKEDGLTFPGKYMLDLLAQVELTPENVDVFKQQIESVVAELEECDVDRGRQTRSYHLSTFMDCLNIVSYSTEPLSRGEAPMYEGFRVHIAPAKKAKRDRTDGLAPRGFAQTPLTLNYWCFIPGIAMGALQKLGVRNIVVTSGTLSPLQSFSQELRLTFDVSIENPHVVDDSQVWLGIVPSGPSGAKLNSSFKSRGTLEYQESLGNAIANFARVVPDGILVFFPSFSVMSVCINTWQRQSPNTASSIWEHITRYKWPIVEPRDSQLFQQADEDFNAKLEDPSRSGAIFFGVCRGKASEGLDFSDKAGRAVIITGIPYAMKTDPWVTIKREVLDDGCKRSKGKGKANVNGRGVALTGSQWYSQQAHRAVNQALGRVIRHRHDYGAILLCDERFLGRHAKESLSKWLIPHAKSFDSFGQASASLTRFFRDKKEDPLQRARAQAAARPRAEVAPPAFAVNRVMDTSGLSSLARSFDAIKRPEDGEATPGGSQLLGMMREREREREREKGNGLPYTTDNRSEMKLTERLAMQRDLVCTQTVVPANRLVSVPSSILPTKRPQPQTQQAQQTQRVRGAAWGRQGEPPRGDPVGERKRPVGVRASREASAPGLGGVGGGVWGGMGGGGAQRHG